MSKFLVAMAEAAGRSAMSPSKSAPQVHDHDWWLGGGCFVGWWLAAGDLLVTGCWFMLGGWVAVIMLVGFVQKYVRKSCVSMSGSIPGKLGWGCIAHQRLPPSITTFGSHYLVEHDLLLHQERVMSKRLQS